MSNDLLPAISRAVTLATRLRVISDRGRDAEFKGIVADLLLELAEAQMKVDELLNENAALKGQMQSSSNPKGERCPRCFEFGWRVTPAERTASSGGWCKRTPVPSAGSKKKSCLRENEREMSPTGGRTTPGNLWHLSTVSLLQRD